MITCFLCKRVTGKKEPTGKFTTYFNWIDKQGQERKDIKYEKKVCANCNGPFCCRLCGWINSSWLVGSNKLSGLANPRRRSKG